MKKIILILLVLYGCSLTRQAVKPEAPEFVKGAFTDDYGIKYQISDSVWTQLPRTKFHIIKWNKEEQYLIARNSDQNPTEPGLYTRIDYMRFDGMAPFLWGFCLSVFKAKSGTDAEAVKIADRKNPIKGCNGFPFSRMKRI